MIRQYQIFNFLFEKQYKNLLIQNPFWWILLGIASRLCLFLYQVSYNTTDYIDGYMGYITGDTNSYILPVENFFKSGNYSPDLRMPGYPIFYGLLRLFIDVPMAANALIIIQVILSGISVFYLAFVSFYITKSKKIFLWVFFIFLFSSYSAVYNVYLIPEGLCTSISIFSIYFFVLAIDCKNDFRQMRRRLLIAGSFFACMVFLRPAYAPLLIVGVLLLFRLLKSLSLPLKKIVPILLLFTLPFLIADSVWMARNYFIHKKIIPLQKSIYYPEFNSYLFQFIQSYGGIHSAWAINGHDLWFEGNSNLTPGILFPQIINKPISYDSLFYLKDIISKSNDKNLAPAEKQMYDSLSTNTLIRYTLNIKKKNPVLYYVIAPFKLAKFFYSDSGTYLIFHKTFAELNIFQKIIKLLLSVLNTSIILFSIIALFHFIFCFKNYSFLHGVINIFSFYSLIFFPFIMRMPETRFLVPGFPLLIISAVVFISRVLPFPAGKARRETGSK